MTLPSISVITPTFNQGKFLEKTILSVLDQNYPSLEYIVIDGGSTDGTIKLLKGFGDRISWISEQDDGQTDAINKGLAIATGEVLGIINSDDLYEEGALTNVGKFFFENPRALWMTGKCRIIDLDGKEIRRLITLYKNFWLRLNMINSLYVLNYISQPATFWRKKLVDQIGIFSETLHYAMDYDYWLRACQRTKLKVNFQYLAKFRIYSESKSGSGFIEQFEEEFSVAHRYTTSKLLLGLHAIHRNIIVSIYKSMSASS